ncbi:MAG: MBL fold metallo-hydrolase [Candidatus Woesearchaeota archaeon]
MVQLIFLGTAGDSVVFGKQLRASGGIVLKIGNYQFHLDPGPGALARASQNGIDVLKSNFILVSHNHLNHCNDLNALIDALTLGGIDKKGYLISTNSVINGSDNEKPVLTNFHKESLIKYMVLEPGRKVGIDDIEIIATKTKHTTENIGFKIITPKIIVSYLSDTEYFKELETEHSDANVLILNVVKPNSIKQKGNLNSEDACRIIESIRPNLAIITHFGIEMLKENPLTEARNIAKKTSTNVMAAKDGMSINLDEYAPNHMQTKIINYQ